MIKTGREENLPKIDPNDESTRPTGETFLSPLWRRTTRSAPAQGAARPTRSCSTRTDKGWMLANIDYSIVGSKDVQILECKTAGEFGSRLVAGWATGVRAGTGPAPTGCHRPAGGGCVRAAARPEDRDPSVERDEEVIARLIELERRFWEYVITDTPPPADGSDSSGKALQALYPYDRGDTLDLSEDEDFSKPLLIWFRCGPNRVAQGT
jgi:hypothetical protein